MDFLSKIRRVYCRCSDSRQYSNAKEIRIERSMSPQGVACIECHKSEHPGLFADWAKSRHANANITCLDCHQAEASDKDVSKTHFQQYERLDLKWGKKEYRVPLAAAVTPKDWPGKPPRRR